MTRVDAISLPKLQGDVHRALKLWHRADTETSPLDYLCLFQRVRRQGVCNARQTTNELLLDVLNTLEAECDGEDVGLLRLRFLITRLCTPWPISSIWPNQRPTKSNDRPSAV